MDRGTAGHDERPEDWRLSTLIANERILRQVLSGYASTTTPLDDLYQALAVHFLESQPIPPASDRLAWVIRSARNFAANEVKAECADKRCAKPKRRTKPAT